MKRTKIKKSSKNKSSIGDRGRASDEIRVDVGASTYSENPPTLRNRGSQLNLAIEVSSPSSQRNNDANQTSRETATDNVQQAEDSWWIFGKNLASGLSSVAGYAGTALPLVDTWPTKITGTICNGLSFFGKQTTDFVSNQAGRNKINSKREEIDKKQKGKQGGSAINIEPSHWYLHYGLNLNGWSTLANVLTTMANASLQLAVIAINIVQIVQYRDAITVCIPGYNNSTSPFNSTFIPPGCFCTSTVQTSASDDWKLIALGLSLAAIALDKVEQHYKSKYLTGYQQFLTQLELQLDKLPNLAEENIELVTQQTNTLGL
jgi:hypothetical protein